jgi:trehalose 6-phosphate phosphatase
VLLVPDETAPPWPGRPALFLDLDGTLLQIADHPDHVTPSPRLLAVLGRLPASVDGAIAVISGRPVEDIDRLLAPHRFPVAAVHGLVRRDATGDISTASGDALLADARERAKAFVAMYPGLLLEDKGLSLALHYRRRPELEAEVHRFIAGLDLPQQVERLPGRMVVELKLRGADKGKAIRAFMAEEPFRGRTPVFIGDDVTDEAGFEAVNELSGVSVKVRDGKTAARWRLDDVEDVLEWLERVVDRDTDGSFDEAAR